MAAIESPSRRKLRHRRKRAVRSRTLHRKELTKAILHLGALAYPPMEYWRPRCRADCQSIERPCPFVSCMYNLYLDVSNSGVIKLNFPDLEPWEIPPNRSCVLDVAEDGEHTLEETGIALNLTRERVRQVEQEAFAWLRGADEVQPC